MAKAKKILVVDEDPASVAVVEADLVDAGYQVSDEHDGLSAFEIVIRDRPDLVILEPVMAKMDGWDILRALQTDPRTKPIPVIILSILHHDDDIFLGWSLGQSTFHNKPVNLRELRTSVCRILAAQEEPIPETADPDPWDLSVRKPSPPTTGDSQSSVFTRMFRDRPK